MSPVVFQAICRNCGKQYPVTYYSLVSQAACPWCGTICAGWLREDNGSRNYCIYPGVNIIKGYFSGGVSDKDVIVYDDEKGFAVLHDEPQVISITYCEEEKAFYANPSDLKLNLEDITEPARINAGDKLTVGYREFSLLTITDSKPQETERKPAQPYEDPMAPCV